MIIERMAGANILNKVKQLETFSKSSLIAKSCKPLQFNRTSTSLAGINRCLNPNVVNNTNSRFLTKFPISSTVVAQQTRTSSTSPDHVRLWVMEKIVSAALPVLVPAALLLESPIVDGLLATLIVMHTHWGLEAIVVDYARPIVVGNLVPKIAHLSLNLLSICTLAGLLLLIYNGPGISKSIKNFWAIGKEQKNE